MHRCEPHDYPPFWAITRHAHICEISKQPDRFLNQPGITHQRTEQTIDRSEGIGAMRTIIEMDPPEHRSFRKVASPWFTPRALDRIGDDEDLARSRTDRDEKRRAVAEAEARLQVVVRRREAERDEVQREMERAEEAEVDDLVR